MFELNIETGKGTLAILRHEGGLNFNDIRDELEKRNLLQSFYIVHHGRLVTSECTETLEGRATLVPRVAGGKGGFGSMLRAIGAQIEKTTNREACRDLSGRRLRDINEEKRLKAWIEKQDTREEEEVLRKKRKLEKLCAVPKHEFKDAKYEEERSGLVEKVEDAVEEGLKMAAETAIITEAERKEKLKRKGLGQKTILDDDFDSDELGSSDDSEDEGSPRKKFATEKHNKSMGEGSKSSAVGDVGGSDGNTEDNSECSTGANSSGSEKSPQRN